MKITNFKGGNNERGKVEARKRKKIKLSVLKLTLNVPGSLRKSLETLCAAHLRLSRPGPLIMFTSEHCILTIPQLKGEKRFYIPFE